MEKMPFDILLSILRMLEREDYTGKSVEQSIITLIGSFIDSLSPEQKNEIFREFAGYEMDKRSDKGHETRKRLMSDLAYRDIVESTIFQST